MRRARGLGVRALRERDLDAVSANGSDVGRLTPGPGQIEPEGLAVEVDRTGKVVDRKDGGDGLDLHGFNGLAVESNA